MNLLLTDILRCPRCGPAFGLVLLADQMDEQRRVQSGHLGCANCRTLYPIRNAVLDLRVADETPLRPTPPREGDEALRLAALLGLAESRGRVAIRGPGAVHAAGVAALAPESEVAALIGTLERPAGTSDAVDRILVGTRLPFAAGSLRGLALTDGIGDAEALPALRLLQSGGRLLVDGAEPTLPEALRGSGARILLEQDGTLVAEVGAAPPVARPAARG